MRQIYFLVPILFYSTNVMATMPELTDEPKPATLSACEQWAAAQSDDAKQMWGIMEDGTSSRSEGIDRLTHSCLGYSVPAIVGFGSSAGFNEEFCVSHRSLKVCNGVASNDTEDCPDLWEKRNFIYKQAGYCFKTARAIEFFGNQDCKYDNINDVPLSQRQRQSVSEVVHEERRLRCPSN